MSVPSTFTSMEINSSRNFLIQHIHDNSRISKARILGDPFMTYGQLIASLGYTIDDQWDGDRVGILCAEISNIEFSQTRLLLSAVVINKDQTKKLPGKGFYSLAQSYQLLRDKKIDPEGFEEMRFWNDHVFQIVHRYGRTI